MAIGGTPLYSWAPAPGSSLPPGLTLSGAGTISGTPTTSGSFAFYVVVTDSGKPAQTATGYFTINVNTGLAITPSVLPPGDVGALYKQVQFGISGNISSGAIWSVSGGGLPPGLTLSPSGLLQGTPTQAGVYSFTVTVGAVAALGSASYIVRISPPLSASTVTIPDTPVNGQVQVTFPVTGGTPPYVLDTRWWIASARSNSQPNRNADRLADAGRNLQLHRAGDRCGGADEASPRQSTSSLHSSSRHKPYRSARSASHTRRRSRRLVASRRTRGRAVGICRLD